MLGIFHDSYFNHSKRQLHPLSSLALKISKMAAHELDVYSLTDIAEIQKAYAQIHLHEVHYKLNAQFLRFILQLSRNFTLKIPIFQFATVANVSL